MAIVTYNYYEDFKQQFDNCMQATANNFVKIGYLLKQARDTDILKESGYSGMGEFAKAEYGLDNSTTSRFIAICDRYGAGDDRLLPEYAEYGYSKLAEMLTLPESVAEAITPELTKEEIREIKQEIREEEKITDVEVCIEKADHPEIDDNNPLVEVVKGYLKEYPKEFKELAENGEVKATDILAPSGSAVLMARVPGIGRMMLTLEDGQPVKLVNVRTNTTEEYSDDQVEAAVRGIFYTLAAGSAEEAYKELYGEDMPKEPAKAPETKKSPEKKKVKIAPAQTKEPEPSKTEKPANPDKQTERKAVAKEESEENTASVETEKPANPDKVTETEAVAKEESEENQGATETPEPANPDKQTETRGIKITKNLCLALKDTRDSAEDLEAAIEDIMVLNEDTMSKAVNNMITRVQELSAALLCNLQDWKAAAEREGK
ncbi:MAG: hypothetical protein IJU87_04660 [Lachnospiraceae bacterium]|nr:hypothetical protein [Lachnospiraceae bacterium]